jgi:hypothetical protein
LKASTAGPMAAKPPLSACHSLTTAPTATTTSTMMLKILVGFSLRAAQVA